MTSIADLIHDRLDRLTPAENRVAAAILASYPGSGFRSARAIALRANVSPATVLRFVAKLGFAGLADLQGSLRDELDTRMRYPLETYEPPPGGVGNLRSTVAQLEVDNVTQTLARLTDDTLDSVRETLRSSSHVLVMGGRASHPIAHYLQLNLQAVRADVRLFGAVQFSPADDLVHIGRGTCMVVFDFRRYSPAAVAAAKAVKARRGKVILVTDPYLSPAAQFSDHTLIVSIEGKSLNDSYTAAVALVDVIISDYVAHEEAHVLRHIRRQEAARQEWQDAVQDL